MNRRRFCLQITAAAAYATDIDRVIGASDVTPYGTLADSRDIYTLWSLLIPIIQTQPGKGYMIASQIAFPDALPYAATGDKKSPLQKAIDAHNQAGYETTVPCQEMVAFSEALADANRHEKEAIEIEHRLQLGKPYRLLSKLQVKAYSDLSPHVAAPDWRPDPHSIRYYKGWNEVSFVSLPFFSGSRDLALVWARTDGGCTSTGWFFFKRIENGWVRLAWPTEIRDECA